MTSTPTGGDDVTGPTPPTKNPIEVLTDMLDTDLDPGFRATVIKTLDQLKEQT